MRSNITNLNPEFIRIVRVSLPRRRILFIIGLTLILIIALSALISIGHANVRLYSGNYGQNHGYLETDNPINRAHQLVLTGGDLYNYFKLALFGLLFVLAPAIAALSFVQERLRGTAIFQQMLLISPVRLAIGKFAGSVAPAYLIAALIAPFFFLAALLGRYSIVESSLIRPPVSLHEVLRITLLLIVGGLCCQAVGLFVSSFLSGATERTLRGGLLIGPVVGAMGAIIAFISYNYFSWYPAIYPSSIRGFYGVGLPEWIVFLIVMAFVGVWAFAATVRRVKINQLIPVRAWPVWAFFASAEALFVGLLWDWRMDGSQPIYHLMFYIGLNSVALMILAASSALVRERVREWWSVERDPLTLFQRQEIKNSLKTFLIALGIAEAGLALLWLSYHAGFREFPMNLALVSQLLPIALSFALVSFGVGAFIQFCALHRFRIGAWSGVAFTLLFAVIMLIAGAMFESKNNTPNLINPFMYAEAITDGNRYMQGWFQGRREIVALGGATTDELENIAAETDHWRRRAEQSNLDSRKLHGFAAQSLLALGCFGLLYMKWNKTRREMFGTED